jgi:serine/threonine protein kinase
MNFKSLRGGNGSGFNVGGAHHSGIAPKSLFGYDVVAPIGVGAASAVYAISEPKSGQLYALKHVVIDSEHDARFIDQLKNEYAVGKTFSHPALRRSVILLDHHTLLRKVTEAALILELFDGEPIAMSKFSRLSSVLKAFGDVAHGLESLHRLGFVHCDLKPGNILFGCHGEGAKIIDFGQTCPIGTVKRRMQGSPDYIAPEQVRCKPVMPRTDVFNLGATIYYVLTSQKMPTAYTVKRDANSFQLDGCIPTPRQLDEGLPVVVSDLVMECVRTDPDKRPEMHELARRLEAVSFTVKCQRQFQQTGHIFDVSNASPARSRPAV